MKKLLSEFAKIARFPLWIRVLFSLTLLLSLMFSATFVWESIQENARQSRLQTLILKEKAYQVEVVVTPERIRQGLSDRAEIGSDGMLFVLPQESRPSFWMYKMQFPLDFIWINGNTVVDIHENIPPASPQTPQEKIPLIQPKYMIRQVLEVPAGFVKKEGIEVGDLVYLAENE